MIVSTLGTKISDDALGYARGKIKNVNRIVELSPFSLNTPYRLENPQNMLDFENEYSEKMFNLDYSKRTIEQIVEDGCDYVIIDMLCARLYLHKFILEDGTEYRITENIATKKNLNKIRMQITKEFEKKIVLEQVINPLLMSAQELECEIKFYAELLKKSIGEERIILLESHNIYQYISQENRIEILPNVGLVTQYNELYDRCVSYLKKYLDCKAIKIPQYLIGDAHAKSENMFHYSELYYCYIVECLENIERKQYTREKERQIQDIYNTKQKIQIEEVMLHPLIDQTYRRRNGKKIVLIGESDVYEYNLKKKYGLTVSKKVIYKKGTTNEELEKQLEEIRGKHEEYICIVPFVYRDSNALEVLWKCGYGLGKGCICSLHAPIRLSEFQGVYEDYYNNRIECKRCMTIELNGVGNDFYIGEGNNGGRNVIIMLNQTKADFGERIQIGAAGFSATFYDGATVEVGNDTTIKNKTHIRASFFTRTKVGEKCVLEDGVVLFNGDGHAIFDLHTGKNVNYDLNNSKPEKHEIVIGDGVFIGKNGFVLSGSGVEEYSYIRDNSFINKVFHESGRISGQPGQLVEEN